MTKNPLVWLLLGLAVTSQAMFWSGDVTRMGPQMRESATDWKNKIWGSGTPEPANGSHFGRFYYEEDLRDNWMHRFENPALKKHTAVTADHTPKAGEPTQLDIRVKLATERPTTPPTSEGSGSDADDSLSVSGSSESSIGTTAADQDLAMSKRKRSAESRLDRLSRMSEDGKEKIRQRRKSTPVSVQDMIHEAYRPNSQCARNIRVAVKERRHKGRPNVYTKPHSKPWNPGMNDAMDKNDKRHTTASWIKIRNKHTRQEDQEENKRDQERK